MELLIIITIIAAIVIYCLLKPSNKTPISPIEEPTKPTPPTKPTTPPNNKKKLVGPFSRTWTLTEFSKEFGPMQFSNNQINSDTKEVFTSCRFIDAIGNITYVNFHRSLGVLTKKEILQKKEDLQVGLNMNGKYVFFIGEAGELGDVDLGL